MLRRLEKGLNSAKMKSHPSEPTSPYNTDEVRNSSQPDSSYLTIHPSDPAFCPPNAHFPANNLNTSPSLLWIIHGFSFLAYETTCPSASITINTKAGTP